MGAGAVAAWIGRMEGFLEEVLHTSLMCRTGGEVILVVAGCVAPAWEYC